MKFMISFALVLVATGVIVAHLGSMPIECAGRSDIPFYHLHKGVEPVGQRVVGFHYYEDNELVEYNDNGAICQHLDSNTLDCRECCLYAKLYVDKEWEEHSSTCHCKHFINN